MKKYSVKELYYTLQGEGMQSGRAAVFLRFSGCNLWSGQERDRASAHCRFCDTDFVGTDGPGGGKFDRLALVKAVQLEWSRATKGNTKGAYVICTGGEPLLQLDAPLIAAFKGAGFEIGVETNGTIEDPSGIDWLCVSPKPGLPLKIRKGNELKFVYPQNDRENGLNPEDFADLDFDYFFLQPMDGPSLEANEREAVEYCRTHPQWRLSLQTHKYLKIP